MLLRCCLIHIANLVILRRVLYLYVCVQVLAEVLCHIYLSMWSSFQFRLIFVVINHITTFNQRHFFVVLFVEYLLLFLDYLKATKEIRKSKTKLLISFLKPYSAVTVKTISRWAKTYLKEAGIDTNTFQGHSLRSSSSSKAKLNGAINYICEISGCKARSNTDCCRNRILTIKENLPSCTFIVILFLEQRVEIRTFLSSLPRFSNWKILYGCKNWIRIGCARISSCKVLISTPCSRNRITIKVQFGKFPLIVKITSLFTYIFQDTGIKLKSWVYVITF